jgi:hypothetical protein
LFGGHYHGKGGNSIDCTTEARGPRLIEEDNRRDAGEMCRLDEPQRQLAQPLEIGKAFCMLGIDMLLGTQLLAHM